MYNFFDFYTKIPKECVLKNLGFEHISIIIFIFAFISFAIYFLKKASFKKQNIIIKISAILVPVFEISHNIWLYIYGDATLPQLLSLHLCGLQRFFIPLAVFTKALVFKDFIFATSILGGIFAIIFPSGITNSYPLWHFRTIQTFIYHALLIFVPVAILTTSDYRPSLKRFYKVLILFFIIALTTFSVDVAFDQNYLFLIKSPDMFLLNSIQTNYGTVPYLFFTFFALLFICIGIHLPFELHNRKLKKD